jgi:hypothetical protein
MKYSKCSTCKAAIIFARSERGTLMPVDAQPHEDGTLALDDTGGPEPVARFATAEERTRMLPLIAAALGTISPRLHRSHFATCPDAGSHRRKPKRKGGR